MAGAGGSERGGSPTGRPAAGGGHARVDQFAQMLSRAAIFQRFTPTGLQIFAGIAHEKTLPAGTPLFVENMIGETLFVIVDGLVRIESRDPDGRPRALAQLGPGDSLGEVALLRVGPRLCSATAETDTRVLEISRRDVTNLMKAKPQACLKLMMSVSEILGARVRDIGPDLRNLL